MTHAVQVKKIKSMQKNICFYINLLDIFQENIFTISVDNMIMNIKFFYKIILIYVHQMSVMQKHREERRMTKKNKNVILQILQEGSP